MPNIQCRSKNRVFADNSHLKKQSQFAAGQIYVITYMKRTYGNMQPNGAHKNKAKQTQFLLAPSTAGGLKKQSQLLNRIQNSGDRIQQVEDRGREDKIVLGRYLLTGSSGYIIMISDKIINNP
jgi:hypothetical protein